MSTKKILSFPFSYLLFSSCFETVHKKDVLDVMEVNLMIVENVCLDIQ